MCRLSSTSNTLISSIAQFSTSPNNRKVGIVFDLDGVLLKAKHALPFAREALLEVTPKKDGGASEYGIPHVFVTNGGGVHESVKAKQLSDMFNLNIIEEQVIVSHSPMKELVPTFQNQLIMVAGMHEVKKVALRYGFRRVITPGELQVHLPNLAPHCYDEPPHADEVLGIPKEEHSKLNEIAAIMVLHDPRDWYKDLQILTDVLVGYIHSSTHYHHHITPRTPPKVYFSNNDFVFSGVHPYPRLAQGAFRICLAALYKELTGTDLKYTMYGKPFATTYRYAEKQLELRARKYGYSENSAFDVFYGIGDNPLSDIVGANSAGPKWRSVFLKSGTIVKAGQERTHNNLNLTDEQKLEIPNYTFDHVYDSIKFIKQRESI